MLQPNPYLHQNLSPSFQSRITLHFFPIFFTSSFNASISHLCIYLRMEEIPMILNGIVLLHLMHLSITCHNIYPTRRRVIFTHLKMDQVPINSQEFYLTLLYGKTLTLIMYTDVNAHAYMI